MGGLVDVLELLATGPVHGRVAAPGSKSHTNRALVAAALAVGESCLRRPLLADDVAAMVGGLRAMGAQVAGGAGIPARGGAKPAAGEEEGSAGVGRLAAGSEDSAGGDEALAVVGTGGHLPDGEVEVDAGLSGTTLRFLTAVATLSPGVVTLTGEAPLRARPVGPLTDALQSLGCAVRAQGGRPPVVVAAGRPHGGRVVVDASTSSQFVTSLLLVGPYAEGDLEVVPTGLGARGYVDLTVALMRRWGAGVREEGEDGALVVEGGRPYRARREDIAGDASAAGHLFALAVATGGEVRVANLGGASTQPDLGLLEILAELGAQWRWDGPDAVVVSGPERLRPIEADLRRLPDQLPTLAVLAALAGGRSVLTGLSVARHHETDRVAAVAAELAKVGVDTEAGEDTLVVHGGRPGGGPALIHTHHDHRMAMAFAALGARCGGIAIADPGCVSKTYPGFWDDARRLGLEAKPAW